MDVIKEKWEEIIQKLKVEYFLSNISFETWIRPLEVYEIRGNTLYLTVNFKASIEHIQNKYLLPLKVCIAEVTGTEYQIKFIPRDLPREQQRRYLEKTVPVKEKTHKHKEVSPIAEKANLNPKYTFDTFVVGGNNNFALAASLAVAESPGEVYNPLFLYGGVGLGKTHLMHSIAHFIIENDDNSKVLYVTSEEFTNELIETIRNGNNSAMSKFREKYRNIDVLLVDDIHGHPLIDSLGEGVGYLCHRHSGIVPNLLDEVAEMMVAEHLLALAPDGPVAHTVEMVRPLVDMHSQEG